MFSFRMKILMASFFSFCAIQTQAQTLDISKFKSKAQAAVEALIGKNNIIGTPKVIFRDGAGAMDLEPLFDYASYIYAVKPKPGILPSENLMLGYRLQLQGREDVVVFESGADDSEILVAMAGAGVATFKEGAAKEDLEALVVDLKKGSPNADIQLLNFVGMITFNAPVLDGPKLIQNLLKSPLVNSVALDNENYRVPYAFDPIIEVKDKGKFDANKYRQLTKTLKEQGLAFASETTIPTDLQ